MLPLALGAAWLLTLTLRSNKTIQTMTWVNLDLLKRIKKQLFLLDVRKQNPNGNGFLHVHP